MRLTHCPVLLGSLRILLSSFFHYAWFHTPTEIYNMLYLSTIMLQWCFVEALTVVALSWVAIIVSNLVAFSHSGVLSWRPIPSHRCHSMMDCCVLWQGPEMIAVMDCDRLPRSTSKINISYYYWYYHNNDYRALGEITNYASNFNV